MFSLLDMDDFKMQLIEFQSSSISKQKFVDIIVDLENIKKEQLEKVLSEKNAENEVSRTWNTIPENFICLKSFATALLLMFSSTYACESVWSVINFVKSHKRSSLMNKTNSAVIFLKVTNGKPNIKFLSLVMQQQECH